MPGRRNLERKIERFLMSKNNKRTWSFFEIEFKVRACSGPKLCSSFSASGRYEIASACRCFPSSPFETAVANSENSDKPYYTATVVSEKLPSNINGQIVYTVLVTTGCNTHRIQTVTTCGNSACFGVRLQKGQSYAIPLFLNGVSTSLNSGQRFSAISRLTTAQRNLVSRCSTQPSNGIYQCSWKCKFHPARRCSNHCRRYCKDGKCEDTNYCMGRCYRSVSRCGPTPASQKSICSMECRDRPRALPLPMEPRRLIAPCFVRCRCCCLNGRCTRDPCERQCYLQPNCGYSGVRINWRAKSDRMNQAWNG